jgi:AraC-like DNA-binding protein
MEPFGARIFFWGARALYTGEALGLEPHRNAVSVLCAGISGSFSVAVDPEKLEAGYRTVRVALIPANTLHHLKVSSGRMAFLYVDANSNDYVRLHESAVHRDERLAWGFEFESGYIASLVALNEGRAWPEVRGEIATALGIEAPIRRDERIHETLRLLREEPAGSHSLADLARRAGLSPSRFRHLFKEATGVPVRRYKIWNRMGCAVRSMAAGQSLTDAALLSGFSSSAHFSAAFKEMFGMAPSRLAQMQPGIEA